MTATIPQAAKTPPTAPTLADRAREARCGMCWAEPGDPLMRSLRWVPWSRVSPPAEPVAAGLWQTG
jgi:hypothetical protein